MECLTTGFLQQRKEWLSQLRIGRHDYETRENYNLIGLVGPWVFDGLWFVGLFCFVGLLSYIELCGDDNFLVFFNCIYYNIIYIYNSSFILFVKAVFPPPKKKHRPSMPQLFFEKLFHTKDVVAECGHRLLEGVCVPPSTVQISHFLLLKRKSGRRIPTVPGLP